MNDEANGLRRWHASQSIDAPASVVWGLLVDIGCWPQWGPSIRSVTCDESTLTASSRGAVHTIIGLTLPFEVTAFDDGVAWSWNVAGVPATDHTVEPLGDDRCLLTFGVPLIALPYLAVCRVALRRIDRLATADRMGTSEHGSEAG